MLIFGLFFLLAILIYFLIFRQDPTRPNPTALRPTIVPQQQRDNKPSNPPFFRSSPDLNNNINLNVVFDLPQGQVLPESVDGVIVKRTLDENLILNLLSGLGITGEPRVVKNTISWSFNDKSLLIDTSSGYVLYGQSGDNSKQNQTTMSIEEIERKAVEFINGLKFVNIAPNTANTRFYRGKGEIVETDSFGSADFIEFSYQQAFNNTPIYYNFATPASISVTTDKEGNVLRLQYFNIQPVEVVGSVRVDFEKIKSDVKQGKFTVVNISDSPSLVPVNQGTITITNAKVAYFDDKNSERFYPIVLFEGILQPGTRNVSLYYSIFGN